MNNTKFIAISGVRADRYVKLSSFLFILFFGIYAYAGEIIRPNVELALSTMMSTGETPSYISVSPDSFSLDHTAHSISITVSSNVSYWYSDNKTWISPQGSNTFSIQENNSGADRSGTITYKYGGIIEEIIIQQSRNSAIQDITLGTGSLVSDSYNDSELTPFGTYWEDNRTQYLVKAEELISLGFSAGNIYSLAFNVASNGGKNLDYMEVNIGTTNIVELTDHANIGMSTVYSGSRPISTGWNTINFDSPFFWNGATNIIVQVCFDNDSKNNNTTIYYSNTSFASTFGEYCNGVTGCSPNYFYYESSRDSRPNMILTVDPSEGIVYPGSPKLSPSHDVIPSTSQNYIQTIAPRVGKSDITTNETFDAIETIQYLDGLGRPIQTLSVKASPTGADIILPIEYDDLGREGKKYLPYTNATNNGQFVEQPAAIAAQSEFYNPLLNSDLNYAKSSYPYSETVFDGSPLNRVVEQSAPGYDWSLNATEKHTVVFAYTTNTSSIASWIFDGTQYITTMYPAGRLFVNETYGENYNPTKGSGHLSREYKDNLGRTIIVESLLEDGTALRTHNIYDYFGNLSCVIPPEASMPTDDEFCYHYRYDHKQQMIAKKIPGADWVYMAYDNRDRLALTSNGNMNKATLDRDWMFTKYDELDRPIMTGLISTKGWDRQSCQDLLDNETLFFEEAGSALDNYTNNSFPTGKYTGGEALVPITMDDLLTIAYYDDYSARPASNFNYRQPVTTGLTNDAFSGFESSYDSRTIGLTMVTKVKNFETNEWYTTVYYYDSYGRVIQTVSNNQLGGYDRVSTKYNFAGEVLATVHEHTTYNNGLQFANIIIGEHFVYDHAGRLLENWQQMAGEEEIMLAANKYNELGEMVEKYNHGVEETDGIINALQKTDYKYNIRGWITSINDPANLGDDLFAMKMIYTNSDNSININGSPDIAQYNGNISGIIWNNTIKNEQDAYYYQYDGVNRLLTAQNLVGNSGVWSTENSFSTFGLSYDKNGNIETLQRYNTSALIDNLTYTYENSNHSNRLSFVTDATANNEGYKGINSGTVEYTYDDNGNLIVDNNKNINISYNILNLPNRVEPINTPLPQAYSEYVYDANGTKLYKKTVRTDLTGMDETKYTYYVAGFEYYKAEAYFRGNLIDNTFRINQLNLGEGRLILVDNANKYEYHIKDHLGNVRVAFSDDDENGTIEPGEITQVNDYYAFGLKHTVATYPNNADQKYMYNGKEWDDEFKWYDFGARMYDAHLGRWFVIDPLCEKKYSWTPYRFGFNNPIFFTDPTGMEELPPNFIGPPNIDDWYKSDRTANYGFGNDWYHLAIGNFFSDFNNFNLFRGEDWFYSAFDSYKNGLNINFMNGIPFDYGSTFLTPQGRLRSGYYSKSVPSLGFGQYNTLVAGYVLPGAQNLNGTSFRLTKGGKFSPKLYKTGWGGGGAGGIKTFKLPKTVPRLASSGTFILGTIGTGLAYQQMIEGNTSPLNFMDATVGTMSLMTNVAFYFNGVQIPVVGEAIAVYGMVRVSWDLGFYAGYHWGFRKWIGDDDTKYFK